MELLLGLGVQVQGVAVYDGIVSSLVYHYGSLATMCFTVQKLN